MSSKFDKKEEAGAPIVNVAEEKQPSMSDTPVEEKVRIATNKTINCVQITQTLN
jgi:hypothetical protein